MIARWKELSSNVSRHVLETHYLRSVEDKQMARSIRILYQGVQGRVRRNFNWPPITEKSAVVITAAEWAPAGGIFGLTVGRPNLGDANVYVTNIGPHNPEGGSGGVEFHLHADFGSPLNVIVTISVLEDIEDFVVG
jgi:hypothetical protein